MADHMVGGDAEGVAITPIPHRGGFGAVVLNELVGEIIKMLCGNARRDFGHEHVEALRSKLTSPPHPLETFSPVDGDIAVLQRRRVMIHRQDIGPVAPEPKGKGLRGGGTERTAVITNILQSMLNTQRLALRARRFALWGLSPYGRA